MIGDEAAKNVPAGIPVGDPSADARMNDMLKMRGSDYARAGIRGAGLGAKAAQGTTNPLSAFIQGMAAGLQAPAQIYEAKKEQVQSALDATPFGATHKEIVASDPAYKILAGLPTKLALEVIGKIAQDAFKVTMEGEETRKTQKAKAEIDFKMKEAEAAMAGKSPDKLKDLFDIANKFSSISEVTDFNNARSAYEPLAAAPGNAAGDKTMLINFARLLSPTFRGNEGTMAAVDVSGILDKATIGLWNKAIKGEELQPSERAMIKREATRLFNTKERSYQERMSFWREKAADMGFDPSVIGRKYGQAVPMKTKMGEVVYVVDNGDGQFIEVGGE